MSAAAGIVGLGMQAVGTFQSTNTKSLDKSNAYAIRVAEQNAKQQEALLRQQAAASDQFNKFQYEQQLLMYQGQRDLARQQIESQYQANLYSNQISTLQNEVQRYGQKINSELQKASYNLEYENSIKQNALSRIENQLALQAGQLSRNAKRTDIEGTKALQEISKQLETQKLNLSDVALAGQRGNLDIQRQGLEQERANLSLSESQARRGLDTAQAQGNIQEMQGQQGAYNQRGDFYRQLLSQFTGNEKEYQKYAARLNALGIDTGVQGTGLAQDMNNNSDVFNQMQSQRNQFGQQMGNAALTNEMTQGQIKGARQDIQDQGLMKRNALGLTEMGLRQQDSSLVQQQMGNNLGRQGLQLQSAQQDMERQSLLASLSTEDTYDVFSRQLLPDLRSNYTDNVARQQLALQMGGNALGDYQNDFNYNMNNQGLRREREANAQNTNNADVILGNDYDRQTQAAGANYTSTLGNTQSALAAALAQIASNQYGVLSSLSSPSSGGGFNWSGVNGLLSQAAQMFGSMGNGGNNQVPQYTTMSNPMQAQTQNFNRPTGQITGTMSSGGFR